MAYLWAAESWELTSLLAFEVLGFFISFSHNLLLHAQQNIMISKRCSDFLIRS